MTATRSGRIRRVVIPVGLFLTVAVLISSCYTLGYFTTQNIDNVVLSDADKEKLFSATFPSRQEIENYFSDATILMSNPPIENNIILAAMDVISTGMQAN